MKEIKVNKICEEYFNIKLEFQVAKSDWILFLIWLLAFRALITGVSKQTGIENKSLEMKKHSFTITLKKQQVSFL